MAGNRAYVDKPAGPKCPGCGTELTVKVAIELGAGDLQVDDQGNVSGAAGKVIGAQVNPHNCVPPVYRRNPRKVSEAKPKPAAG